MTMWLRVVSGPQPDRLSFMKLANEKWWTLLKRDVRVTPWSSEGLGSSMPRSPGWCLILAHAGASR
jgi:hypothetical protein